MKTWIDWAMRLALIVGMLTVAAVTPEWGTCAVLLVLVVVLVLDGAEMHIMRRRLELQDELLALTQAENLALQRCKEKAK